MSLDKYLARGLEAPVYGPRQPRPRRIDPFVLYLRERVEAWPGLTEDNGEVYEVRARANGDHTVINGRRGRIEAPPTVVSNHPWNHEVVDRTLLFDTQRGRLQEVQVTPSGTETITVAGRTVAAQKYLVTGDLERELWYDEGGNWLQSRLEHDGDKVTLTRLSVPVRAGL